MVYRVAPALEEFPAASRQRRKASQAATAQSMGASFLFSQIETDAKIIHNGKLSVPQNATISLRNAYCTTTVVVVLMVVSTFVGDALTNSSPRRGDLVLTPFAHLMWSKAPISTASPMNSLSKLTSKPPAWLSLSAFFAA